MKLRKYYILFIAAIIAFGTFAISSDDFASHIMDELSAKSMKLSAVELNAADDAAKAKSSDDNEAFTFRFPNIFKIFRSTF